MSRIHMRNFTRIRDEVEKIDYNFDLPPEACLDEDNECDSEAEMPDEDGMAPILGKKAAAQQLGRGPPESQMDSSKIDEKLCIFQGEFAPLNDIFDVSKEA